MTRGSEADWETLGVDDDAQGAEPWYLRVTVKQESGGDFAGAFRDATCGPTPPTGEYVPRGPTGA